MFSLFALFTQVLFSQESRTNVYLIPGQGSDYRLFDSLSICDKFDTIHIKYTIPEKRMTMHQYAKSLCSQIDTNKEFILIGVSLGGMISSEITEILSPKKTIIISSAKCRNELPKNYRFQKYIPINKIIPKSILKIGALTLQPIVEPDRNKNKQTFKAMLKAKNKKYLKRTINMIINWDKADYNKEIIHIHGTKDNTIPIKNISATHIVNKGSHMMALTRGGEISKIINQILCD